MHIFLLNNFYNLISMKIIKNISNYLFKFQIYILNNIAISIFFG